MRSRRAAFVAAIALCAATEAAFSDDKPAPPAAPPATKPVEEPVLEGEAKKAYEEEKARHLQTLRREKNREMVASHIENLGTVKSRAARDALMEFARGNKNHEYVKHAFDALAKVGDAKAIAFLCSKDGVRAPDFLVQQSAAAALAEARNPKAVDPLLEVMKDPAIKIEVQGAICLALAKSGPKDPRVEERIFQCCEDKRDTIRANAIEALGYIASAQAMERLVWTIQSEKNTRVRAAAATGLGWTKNPAAAEPLRVAAANDKSLTVKDAAMRALKELGAAAK